MKVYDNSSHSPPIYFTNNTHGRSFAFIESGQKQVCGYTLVKTEHPKFFIFPTTQAHKFATDHTVDAHDILLSAYFDIKLNFLSFHLKTEITALYKDVVVHRCRLEREVLKNSLAFASSNPDEFAYTIMKAPGHMAIVAGEVAHLIQCKPILVKYRHREQCYVEIPVWYRNETYFLTTKSQILIRHGTEINCNPLLPAIYKIDNTWIKSTPTVSETQPPQILQPLNKPTWTYRDAGDFTDNGIYTQKDINKLRDITIFPAEKAAVLNSLVRGMTGVGDLGSEFSMSNMFNEKTLNSFFENTAEKVWNKFIIFGSFSAGLISLGLILGLIKYAINTLLHGYALYNIYGWSVKLFCALFSTLANLLIHASTGIFKKSTEQTDIEKPLESRTQDNMHIYPTISYQDENVQDSLTMQLHELRSKVNAIPVPQK